MAAIPKMNTSSCEKYIHKLACSHGNYVCQRESWFDCAPCPPPLSYRGSFTSFMMEHLNQSNTEIIVNRCSRGWPYIETTTTTTTTKAASTGLSSTESTGLSSTESTDLSLKGNTKTTASVASSSIITSATTNEKSDSTKIAPVLPTLPTPNAGIVVGVSVAVGVILVICVGILLVFLRRRFMTHKGQESKTKRNRIIYAQFSYQSGGSTSLSSDVNVKICEIQNGEEIKFSSTLDNRDEILSFTNAAFNVECNVADNCLLTTGDVHGASKRQIECSRSVPNNCELQGFAGCNESKCCPAQYDDILDSVSQSDYNENKPYKLEVPWNIEVKAEHDRVKCASFGKETTNEREYISCDDLNDDKTILKKKENETLYEPDNILTETEDEIVSADQLQSMVNGDEE